MKPCRDKEEAEMPKSVLASPYERRGLAVRSMASLAESAVVLVKAFLPRKPLVLVKTLTVMQQGDYARMVSIFCSTEFCLPLSWVVFLVIGIRGGRSILPGKLPPYLLLLNRK